MDSCNIKNLPGKKCQNAMDSYNIEKKPRSGHVSLQGATIKFVET